MNNGNELKKIEQCIKNGRLCAVEREYVDTFSMYGFPFDMSEELIMIEFVYDFRGDGFKVIRKKDVTGVYCTEAEQFLEKVIKSEKTCFNEEKPDVGIDSMRTLLCDLKNKGALVTIECEDFEENIIVIGKITGVGEKDITMRTFDGRGVWDSDEARVYIDDITCVSIGNSYVNIISKYLREE